jgi:hypothetical protein
MTDALFDAEDDAATPITPDERAQLTCPLPDPAI